MEDIKKYNILGGQLQEGDSSQGPDIRMETDINLLAPELFF